MPLHLPSYSAAVVLVFAASVACGGYLLSRRSRIRDASDYFFAGCTTGWMSLGASLFVTTVAGGWLLGAGGSSVWQDGPFLFNGLLALVFLLILGRWFAPHYIDACTYTVPQYLERYCGRPTATTLSGLMIALNLAVRIPAVLVAGSWLLKELFGWSLMSSAMLILVVTGLYTIAGGYSAMMATQALQAVVVFFGLLLLIVSGITPVVPVESLFAHVQMTVTSFFASGMNEGMPWPIPFAGALVIGVWYWGADQFVIQRIVATRNIRQVRRGTMLAAILTFVALCVAAALFSGWSSLAETMDGSAANLFMIILLISFLSLMMASLSGYFQSTAVLFTLDFYQRARPGASNAQLVLVGRLATTAAVVLAVLVVSGADLVGWRTYVFMQEVTAAFAPPIAVFFLAALLGRRMNGRGALYALISGELLGVCYFGIKFLTTESSGSVFRVASIDALSFAFVSFLFSATLLPWSSRVAQPAAGESELSSGSLNSGMQLRK